MSATTKTVKFRLRNETKNALRYEEIDSNNRVITFDKATIGTLYLRKAAIDGMPDTLTVTLSLEGN